MDFGAGWQDIQGRLKLGDGFVRAPLLEQSQTKVVAGIRKVRFYFQSFLKLSHGFVQPARLQQRFA